MLIGEYRSSLGDKNRIALPKNLRNHMAAVESTEPEMIVTRGYENCLLVLDKQRWQHLVNSINRQPLLSLSVRDTKRFLLGGAHTVTLDSQGRFVIPESLRLYAAVTTDIVLLGVGEWVEIWSLKSWQEKLEQLQVDAADIAERLENNA